MSNRHLVRIAVSVHRSGEALASLRGRHVTKLTAFASLLRRTLPHILLRRQLLTQWVSCLVCFILSAAAAAPAPDPICFEAELGINVRPNFEIIPRDGASGGYALGVFEGGGGNHNWLGGPSCSVDIGTAEYPFEVREPGRYVVWARAWWSDKCGNSVLVSIDGRQQYDLGDRQQEDHVLRKWHWAPSWAFELAKGQHTLNVMAKEDGIFIDQWTIAPVGVRPSAVGKTTHVPALSGDPVSALDLSVYRDSEVTDGNGQLSFVAWIRKCKAGKVRGRLLVSADEDPKISCGAETDFELAEDELLRPIPMKVTYPASSPRSEKRVTFKVAYEGVTLTKRVLVVTKPWRWHFLGPLPQYADLTEKLGKGLKVSVDEPMELPAGSTQKQVRWRHPMPQQVLNRYQTIDFEKLYGDSVGKCVYAYTTVVSPREQQVLMLVNNDDYVWLWINGALVFRDLEKHPAEGYLGRKKIRLSKGSNRILAKIIQSDTPERSSGMEAPNYWLFRLRLRKSNHRPADIWGE